MPTYEYRCAKCGNHVEVYQSFSEAPLTKHEGCGGKLTKVLSPAGIVLKGSGFYKTDNRGSKKATTSSSNGGSSESSSSSSSSKSDSGASKSDSGSKSGSDSSGAKSA